MKTTLPAQIASIEEAKAFLSALHANGEAYHPEDDAAACGICDTMTQAHDLNKLMEDIYNLPGNDGRHINLAFDPCEWLLYLEVGPFTVRPFYDGENSGFTIHDKDGIDFLGEYFQTEEEAKTRIRRNYDFEIEVFTEEELRYRDFVAENERPGGLRFLPFDHKCYDVAGTNYTVTDLDNELVQEEHRENAIVIRLDEKEIFRGGTWAAVIAKLRELV